MNLILCVSVRMILLCIKNLFIALIKLPFWGKNTKNLSFLIKRMVQSRV